MFHNVYLLTDFLFFKFVESPAEFFAENKNIAGFDNVSINSTMMCLIWFICIFCDILYIFSCFSEIMWISISIQPGKSLYTTVRELVENSLDSAESISELPVIEITM